MVLDVFVKGCNERFSCGYRGFPKFKCEILRGWNEELGKLYEEISKYLWEGNDNSLGKYLNFFELAQLAREKENGIVGQKIKKILEEYDKPYNEGMKLFYDLFDKEVSPKECKLILDAFERVDVEKFDKSDKETNEWIIESYESWKIMLKYAVEHNENLICG